MVELRVLGTLELRDAEGREVRRVLAQPKRLTLLVYLALTRATHRRDALLALFWPELDAERARLALRQAVHFLRAALGPEVIASRTSEELAVGDGALRCDAVELDRALDDADAADEGASRRAQALDLYRGDLLPGFHAGEVSSELEEWLDGERRRLRTRAARAAWTLAEEAEQARNVVEAAHRARQAVQLAPDDEAGFRRFAALLDRHGDRGGVLRAYDEFARRLRTEFDVEPAAETRALIDAVRARETAASGLSGAHRARREAREAGPGRGRATQALRDTAERLMSTSELVRAVVRRPWRTLLLLAAVALLGAVAGALVVRR